MLALSGHVWRPSLSIASRIVILMVPPLLAMIVLTGIVLHGERVHTQDFERIAGLSRLTGEIGALIHELQKERGATNVVLSSRGNQFRNELAKQRLSTTDSLLPFQASQTSYATDPDGRLRIELEESRLELDRLVKVRSEIDTLSISPSDSFAYFTATISSLMDVVLEGGATTGDFASQRTFLALFNLMQAKERAGQERATGSAGFATARFSPAVYERFQHLHDEETSFLQIFRSYATDEQRRELDGHLNDPISQEVARMRAIAVAGGLEGRFEGVTGASWFQAATRRIDLFRDIELALSKEVVSRAQAEAASARSRLHGLTGLLVVTVGTIGWLCWFTGRSLKRPIRRMTEAMAALAAGDTELTIPYTGRRDEIGAMAAAVAVFRVNANIRMEREKEIAHLARHDALTGSCNRFAFQEDMNDVVAAAENGVPAAILCLDLDDFKSVNDTLGHFAGDELLRTVADRIRTCLRPHDVLARLGGDEFAIIRRNTQSVDEVNALAHEILQRLAVPVILDGQRCEPKASLGIVVTPEHGLDPDELVKRADLALYQAKEGGGGHARLFAQHMETRLEERRLMEGDLTDSIASGAFELHYQPLVAATTERIEGFEALIRWRHPERGVVSPADFIPLAEETGLIVPLGRWIIERACADASTWPDEISVAINVSPLQFKDPLLVRTIMDSLRTHGVRPSRLEIEITESVLLAEEAETLAALHDLRTLGVRISLDDFGTGYSSLSYLRSFPFDKIKIDQSFIRGLGVTESSKAIIQAVAALGHSLGMTITAEGVETPEQSAALREQGCTQLQGFYYSRPRPLSDIPALYESLPVAKTSIRAAA